MDEQERTERQAPIPAQQTPPLLFFGNYDHSIDAKGRIIIPNAYRKALGDSFTLTVESDDIGIAIYPDEAFYAMVKELHALNALKPSVKRKRDHVAKFSYPGTQADNQGRVLLPAKLRQYALGDVRDVEISGALDHIRIVPSEVGQAEDDYYREHREQINEEIGFLGD